jgi:methylthioribose-1-phosphate isomerase
MEQALKITTTVNQAKIQERRNKTFYVDETRPSRKSARLSRGQHRSSNARHTVQHAGVSRTQIRTGRVFLLEIRKTVMT